MRSNQPSIADTLPGIMIPDCDYDRLVELARGTERSMPQVSEYLSRELARAQVVAQPAIDPQVARIGSRISYREDQSGRQRAVTLVWPQDADLERNRLSVLTSIGAALLGMRPGQSIDWPAPIGGARTLTVLTVDNGMPDPGPGRAA